MSCHFREYDHDVHEKGGFEFDDDVADRPDDDVTSVVGQSLIPGLENLDDRQPKVGLAGFSRGGKHVPKYIFIKC